MFQGHFPQESSDEIMAPWGYSLPGVLGLNPKPTIADFSVCLQDYLDQSACVRSFWGMCVCVCVCACAFSHVWLFATLWTEAGQAPLSMGFSRQKYWSRLPCPTPEDLPGPEAETVSPVSPASAARFFTIVPRGKPQKLRRSVWKYSLLGPKPELLWSGVSPKKVHFRQAPRLTLIAGDLNEAIVRNQQVISGQTHP